MSTNCLIGIKNKDNSIDFIYCHFDGYPQGVGKTLLHNYLVEDKIHKLMDLGDLSSLGSEPESNPHAWEELPWDMVVDNISAYNDWYQKIHPDNLCDTYASRGEDCPSKKFDTEQDLLKYFNENFWIEYLYLFQDNKWLFSTKEENKDSVFMATAFKTLEEKDVEDSEDSEE